MTVLLAKKRGRGVEPCINLVLVVTVVNFLFAVKWLKTLHVTVTLGVGEQGEVKMSTFVDKCRASVASFLINKTVV